MSLPVEPESGLFADPIEPAFVEAPEVGELAALVMDRWAEFEPLLTAIDEDGLAIAYVFETRPFDPLADEYKRHVVAKVTKASPLWQCLSGVRLAVQFRRWFWEKYSPEQREAVVYHELRHIRVEEPAHPGEPVRISLAPHDLEEFLGVARRYGAVLPDVERLIKVHSWWEQEQPGVALEPGRSVDLATGEITEGSVQEPDPLADLAPEARRGVLRAADKFRREIEAGEIDVTISTPGREPVTIVGRGGRKPKGGAA